jgi:hypothetical protein
MLLSLLCTLLLILTLAHSPTYTTWKMLPPFLPNLQTHPKHSRKPAGRPFHYASYSASYVWYYASYSAAYCCTLLRTPLLILGTMLRTMLLSLVV